MVIDMYYIGNNVCGDELRHYGVLGMKWGIRRYQNADGTLTEAGKKQYHYKSWGTKHNERKSKKAQSKIDELTASGGNKRAIESLQEKKKRYDYRAKRSAELDSREQQYAERVKIGGNLLVRTLTADHVGGKPYQQYMAMMNSQDGQKTSKKVKAAVASMLGGRLGSTLVKALYIRAGEKEGSKLLKAADTYKKARSGVSEFGKTLGRAASVKYGSFKDRIDQQYEERKKSQQGR